MRMKKTLSIVNPTIESLAEFLDEARANGARDDDPVKVVSQSRQFGEYSSLSVELRTGLGKLVRL